MKRTTLRHICLALVFGFSISFWSCGRVVDAGGSGHSPDTGTPADGGGGGGGAGTGGGSAGGAAQGHQLAYLKGAPNRSYAHFGEVVATDGERFVVGAPDERSYENGTVGAGAAHVFVRTGDVFSYEAQLVAPLGKQFDEFGSAVALSADTVVVGAPGVDGSSSLSAAGAAYVFARTGNGWELQATLRPSNPGDNDEFGRAVAIEGDLIAIGAPAEQSRSQVSNAGESDDSGLRNGAVYLFRQAGDRWVQEAYLKGSATAEGSWFGDALAMHDGVVVVGAFGEDSSAGTSSGAAYVFTSAAPGWQEEARLLPPSRKDQFFGSSLAFDGVRLAVGAPEGTADTGAAYVYRRQPSGEFTLESTLHAPNGDAHDAFGSALALTGDRLMVSSPWEASGATGFNGNQTNNALEGAGATYLFTLQNNSWSFDTYVKPSNGGYRAYFGMSVAAANGVFIVGAYQDSSAGSGVIEDQQPAGQSDSSGAAYVFRFGPLR